MPEFLGPGWVASLDAAVRDAALDAPVTGLTVEYTVPDAPGGPVVYHLVAAGGRLRALDGPAPAADVRVTCDLEVARAVHDGRANAQAALAGGGLRVSGALHRVPELVPLLRAAGAALAPARPPEVSDRAGGGSATGRSGRSTGPAPGGGR